MNKQRIRWSQGWFYDDPRPQAAWAATPGIGLLSHFTKHALPTIVGFAAFGLLFAVLGQRVSVETNAPLPVSQLSQLDPATCATQELQARIAAGVVVGFGDNEDAEERCDALQRQEQRDAYLAFVAAEQRVVTGSLRARQRQ